MNNVVASEMYGVLPKWLRVCQLPHSLVIQLHSKLPVTVQDNLQTANRAQGSWW